MDNLQLLEEIKVNNIKMLNAFREMLQEAHHSIIDHTTKCLSEVYIDIAAKLNNIENKNQMDVRDLHEKLNEIKKDETN